MDEVIFVRSAKVVVQAALQDLWGKITQAAKTAKEKEVAYCSQGEAVLSEADI